MTGSFEQVLLDSPLFEGFTEHGARSVLSSGEVADLLQGTLLFEEGAAPDSVMLLLRGEAEAFVERDGETLVLASIKPGSMIGELAVLSEMARAASVRMTTDATVLRWTAEQFRRLLLRDVLLARAIFRSALETVMAHQQSLIDEQLATRR